MKTGFVSGLVAILLVLFAPRILPAQWSVIPNLQYSTITGILVINDTTVILGAFNGGFIKSTDGGVSWTPITPTGMGTDSIFSLDNCGGYLFAGTNAPVSLYRSSDNGESWSASGQGLPAGTNVNDMTYLDSVTYAATNDGVLSSKDNGTIWKADDTGLNLGQPLVPGAPLIYGTIGITSAGNKLYTLESMTGKGVYSTYPDSIAWKNIGLDTADGFVITSLDSDVFVGTNKGVFMYSRDSTWIERDSGLPFTDSSEVNSILFAKYDSLFFAYLGVSNRSGFNFRHELYLTTNLGENWIELDISDLGVGTISALAANKKFVFAGTQDGAYKIPVKDIVTSVQGVAPRQPTGFSLSQNYPNPFNPTTVITFTVRSSGFVSLTVYDVLGTKVATLAEGSQSAGTHSIVFNGSKYASGVYFYRLTAPGVNMVRKMLLEK